MMKNLTTPQSVFLGLGMIALAIASVPYSSKIVSSAHAADTKIQKIALCNENGNGCLEIKRGNFSIYAY